MSYKEEQKQHQINLLSNPLIFPSGTEGGGKYKGNEYPHILKGKDVKRNLRADIQEKVFAYFNNTIQWWGGSITGNLLSSQIACLNHLFPIRCHEDIVLKILQGIDSNFEKVLKIPNDNDLQYISFEVISMSNLLNESNRKRGANCTSVDAMIIAQKRDGNKYLILIEWKYTENDKSNKSNNDTRHKRYDNLINTFLSKNDDTEALFYKEPYYELMRQTLLAELMVKNESKEWLGISDYIHLLVVPNGNSAYRGKDGKMEKIWSTCLKHKENFKLIDPSDLFEPIKGNPKCKELIDYLEMRYWK